MDYDRLIYLSIALRHLGDTKSGLSAYYVFYKNSPKGHDCHWCVKLRQTIPKEYNQIKEFLREKKPELIEELDKLCPIQD